MNTPTSNASSRLTRRSVLRAGLASTALVKMVHAGTAAKATHRRPNIVFLMGDQHRGDCLGADGNRAIITPNLDRLAKEGAHFRCAYTSVPSCTPARAGILTGLSPWHHGMLGYSRVAPRYPREMPRMLRDAGYYTLGIGKMHFHPQRNTHGYHKTLLDESGRVESKEFLSDYRKWFRSVAPNLNPDATGIGWNDHRAKPYVLPERLHPTCWTGAEAVRFLQSYRGAEPFLLKVSFARPHSPYDAPPRWWKRYEGVELPERVVGDWAARHAQHGKPYGNNLWQGDLGPEKPPQARQGYYGNVSLIDEQIGRILEVLQQRGEFENTLIVYTADHGDMLGDHHLWRKTYGYEPSARIPMLLRWGDGFCAADRGQVLRQPVELRDLLPTYLDAAGIDYDPSLFDGRSMLEVIRGKAESWREYIDLEHATCYAPENNWTGLTDGRIKYIYYAPDGRQQMFDLEKDPGETRDLSAEPEHQETLRTWRRRMIDHLAERGGPFVVGGDLGLRPTRTLHSPHYPTNVTALDARSTIRRPMRESESAYPT
ncbi:MAG: arylsulfatase [Pirellulales bacterium]|nr:arylsulfatase [Pirellulales bacterium]